MTRNDRRQLPTKHKERGEQTCCDGSLDDCVHNFARPRVGDVFQKSTLPLAPISTPTVQREVRSAFSV